MQFVNIRSYDNYLFANMQLSLLQENGINCHLKDEHTVTIDPLLNPAIGGIKLMVADAQAERANQILDEAEREWLAGIPCPVCGEKALRKEVLVKEFPGIWGKIKSMLVNGEERVITLHYLCGHCGAQLDDLGQQPQ